jgi:predicted hotdog family 3-hydroxylacyl-ACP dehydratase
MTEPQIIAPIIDPQITALIPHRAPMLLLNRLVSVGDTSACAEIDITPEASFFQSAKGVPAWIGVEYLGQTAALIAGFQLQQGRVEPHLGLLLGTRKFTATTSWFPPQTTLVITCTEVAVVGQNLATFAGEIHDKNSGVLYASAKLSVFRRAFSSEHLQSNPLQPDPLQPE